MSRMSPPVHGVVELVAGIALVLAALSLELGAAGTVLTFAAGALVSGIGLGAFDATPLAVHQALDRWLVFGLAVGSIAAALAGSSAAAAILLATAALQLGLTTTTRWTRAPVAR